MDGEKIKLTVFGISINPVSSAAYAMILEDEERRHRLQVVIGPTEAQSISSAIEGYKSLRPMTHDLFCTFSQTFGIKLVEVCINKFEDGIFSAEMRFVNSKGETVIDSRTSDAVAIALRMGAPIYITRQLLDIVGVSRDDVPETESEKIQEAAAPSSPSDPQQMNVAQLQTLLKKYIADENYEEAARISQILKEKGGK